MDLLAEYNGIIAKLDTDVDDALLSNVREKLLSDILGSATLNVYNAYKPMEYERRYTDGGLLDESNYPARLTGIHELTISNETRGNSQYSDSDGWDSGFINDIIESGIGYHWKNSEIYRNMPYPRPFMDKVLETGISDGTIELALKTSLTAKGWEVR